MDDDSEDFAAALAAFEQEQSGAHRPDPEVGDKIAGTVLSIGEAFAFVDVGSKAEGVLPIEELRDAEGQLVHAVGDTVEALVSGRDASGALLLRLRPGHGETLPEEIRAAHEHGLPVEGVVTGLNKGGAEVEVGGQRGFCPMSQLALRFLDDPTVLVGQRLTFRVTRLEEGGRGRGANLVLSRRVLLQEEADRLAAETRATIAPGADLRGTVTSVASYGAFVDLGGLEGLLHVSEMSHHRVEDPNDFVQVGQELEVRVLKIEQREPDGEERISLSLKALGPDPWHRADERYPVDSRVAGTIVRLETFGAFVELQPGLQGLIHVSELGQGRRVNHAREVLSIGDHVEAKVLAVDLAKKRMSLSLGALKADAEAADTAEAKRVYAEKEGQSTGFGSMADFFAKAEKK